ncbi:hypothetical protein F5148DRAFT_1148517 [Russula earlei]|uniref:Uncharacterized protein n=1 Tax=Russula earlei TaxID=71964 RepID=A0ACC0UBP1_9AGAM|nr:hypothetical protein F5148DRAFT_1148517 [Russula earlei]
MGITKPLSCEVSELRPRESSKICAMPRGLPPERQGFWAFAHIRDRVTLEEDRNKWTELAQCNLRAKGGTVHFRVGPRAIRMFRSALPVREKAQLRNDSRNAHHGNHIFSAAFAGCERAGLAWPSWSLLSLNLLVLRVDASSINSGVPRTLFPWHMEFATQERWPRLAATTTTAAPTELDTCGISKTSSFSKLDRYLSPLANRP